MSLYISLQTEFQLIISLSLFVTLIAGVIGFTAFSYKFIHRELINQVIRDNRVMGEQMLELLSSMNFNRKTHDALINSLQNV